MVTKVANTGMVLIQIFILNPILAVIPTEDMFLDGLKKSKVKKEVKVKRADLLIWLSHSTTAVRTPPLLGVYATHRAGSMGDEGSNMDERDYKAMNEDLKNQASGTVNDSTLSAESFIKNHFKDIDKQTEWYPALVAVADGYANLVKTELLLKIKAEKHRQTSKIITDTEMEVIRVLNELRDYIEATKP